MFSGRRTRVDFTALREVTALRADWSERLREPPRRVSCLPGRRPQHSGRSETSTLRWRWRPWHARHRDREE